VRLSERGGQEEGVRDLDIGLYSNIAPTPAIAHETCQQSVICISGFSKATAELTHESQSGESWDNESDQHALNIYVQYLLHLFPPSLWFHPPLAFKNVGSPKQISNTSSLHDRSILRCVASKFLATCDRRHVRTKVGLNRNT
jgi:hypothetical protein